MKKRLWILLLGLNLAALGADPGEGANNTGATTSDSVEGESAARGSKRRKPHVLSDDGVERVKFFRGLSVDLIEKFEVLKHAAELVYSDDFSGSLDDVTLDQLLEHSLCPQITVRFQNLLTVLGAPEVSLNDIDLNQLIDAAYVADRLAIVDRSALQIIIRSLRSRLSLEEIERGLNLPPEVLNSNLALGISIQLKKGLPDHIEEIIFQPNGHKYLIKFENGTAQQYNESDQKVGSLLRNVISVWWRPNGLGYLVIFQGGGHGQFYNETGVAVGNLIKEDISDVSWQPCGNDYFLQFVDGTAQRYNAYGQKIGERVAEVVQCIYWQPDDLGYWIVFEDDHAQRFSSAGELVGEALNNVELVSFQPDGTDFFVIYKDLSGPAGVVRHNAQRYSGDGMPVGEALPGVCKIYWQQDGRFLTLSDDGRLDGGSFVLDRVKDVYWHPNGRDCFVEFLGNTAVYFVDSFAKMEKKRHYINLVNHFPIVWQQDGMAYIVKFKNGMIQRYNFVDGSADGDLLLNVLEVWHKFNNGYAVYFNSSRQVAIYSFYDCNHLKLSVQLLVQAILNNYERGERAPTKLDPELESMLPLPLEKLLVDYGYMERSDEVSVFTSPS